MSCFSLDSGLERIEAPTLILHGGQDVMTPPANAYFLAQSIPDARLELFEDAGHAVMLEHQ